MGWTCRGGVSSQQAEGPGHSSTGCFCCGHCGGTDSPCCRSLPRPPPKLAPHSVPSGGCSGHPPPAARFPDDLCDWWSTCFSGPCQEPEVTGGRTLLWAPSLPRGLSFAPPASFLFFFFLIFIKGPESLCTTRVSFFFLIKGPESLCATRVFFFLLIFIYWAVPGLSCNTWGV